MYEKKKLYTGGDKKHESNRTRGKQPKTIRKDLAL